MAKQFMSKRFLYRRLVYAVIVVLGVVGGGGSRSGAQEKPQLKRPQEVPDEKRAEPKKTKKLKGPRAVGILQLSNGKATLVPVAILVDGKFYDASVYKADPVPMALESGTVYEAEQAGEPQGLFTTNGALHSKSAGSPSPWLGAGSYLPNGTEAPKTTRKAEDVPVGLDNSGDEPPRLTRKSESASGAVPSSSGAGGSGASEKRASAPRGNSQSAGGEAPKEAGPASDKAPEQGGKEAPEATPAGQASQGKLSEGQAGQGPAAKGGESESYYRPTLRRGKPTQSAPEEEATAAKTVDNGSVPSAAVAGEKPEQLMAAISDAGGPEPQSYKFFWKDGEEEERRKQMLVLAGDEVRAYVTARAKGAIGGKPPATSKGGSRKAVAKPAPIFENIQFRAFDVWKSNQAVMILSAEGHFAAELGAALAPETYTITLVSRTDIYGSLRKLYSGVTDKFHLDVTPRLELIDAVDADGDGRGELVFRGTTDGAKGYVIYRATGDKLWKMFDSLGAE